MKFLTVRNGKITIAEDSSYTLETPEVKTQLKKVLLFFLENNYYFYGPKNNNQIISDFKTCLAGINDQDYKNLILKRLFKLQDDAHNHLWNNNQGVMNLQSIAVHHTDVSEYSAISLNEKDFQPDEEEGVKRFRQKHNSKERIFSWIGTTATIIGGDNANQDEKKIVLDSVHVSSLTNDDNFIGVADGCGGHRKYEQDNKIASVSHLALQAAKQHMAHYNDPEDLRNHLGDIIKQIHQEISVLELKETTTLVCGRTFVHRDDKRRFVGINIGDGMLIKASRQVDGSYQLTTLSPARQIKSKISGHYPASLGENFPDKKHVILIDAEVGENDLIIGMTDGVWSDFQYKITESDTHADISLEDEILNKILKDQKFKTDNEFIKDFVNRLLQSSYHARETEFNSLPDLKEKFNQLVNEFDDFAKNLEKKAVEIVKDTREKFKKTIHEFSEDLEKETDKIFDAKEKIEKMTNINEQYNRIFFELLARLIQKQFAAPNQSDVEKLLEDFIDDLNKQKNEKNLVEQLNYHIDLLNKNSQDEFKIPSIEQKNMLTSIKNIINRIEKRFGADELNPKFKQKKNELAELKKKITVTTHGDDFGFAAVGVKPIIKSEPSSDSSNNQLLYQQLKQFIYFRIKHLKLEGPSAKLKEFQDTLEYIQADKVKFSECINQVEVISNLINLLDMLCSYRRHTFDFFHTPNSQIVWQNYKNSSELYQTYIKNHPIKEQNFWESFVKDYMSKII